MLCACNFWYACVSYIHRSVGTSGIIKGNESKPFSNEDFQHPAILLEVKLKILLLHSWSDVPYEHTVALRHVGGISSDATDDVESIMCFVTTGVNEYSEMMIRISHVLHSTDRCSDRHVSHIEMDVSSINSFDSAIFSIVFVV